MTGTTTHPAVADRIMLPPEALEDFCRRWKAVEIALFGSVLRDDFGPNSDVDVLVSFEPKAGWSLFDLVTMEDELSQIIGRRVDLVERLAVERSENYIRRRNILSSLEMVYAAR
jgi:predicted nucleotidyltransferase